MSATGGTFTAGTGEVEFAGGGSISGTISFNDVTINAARLPDAAGSTLTVTVDVVASAQTSEIYLSTASTLSNGGNAK